MPFLDDDEIWKAIHRESARRGPKHIAVAYLSDAFDLNLRVGDSIVCDASDACIRSGSTSARELRRLQHLKVELYSLEGLHAKVFLLPRCVIVGSANLSENSVR